MTGKKPGDKVTLTILHGGQTKDVQVTLGSPPTVLASDQNGGQGGPQIPRDRPLRWGRGTKVKICGLTNLSDAQRAADLGAWALGMIFWPGSPRACA